MAAVLRASSVKEHHKIVRKLFSGALDATSALLCTGVTPVQRRIRNCLVPATLIVACIHRCRTRPFVATIYASSVVPHRWGQEPRLTYKRYLDPTALGKTKLSGCTSAAGVLDTVCLCRMGTCVTCHSIPEGRHYICCTTAPCMCARRRSHPVAIISMHLLLIARTCKQPGTNASCAH